MCRHQRLKSATIDQVPDALRLPKRRDREPLPPAAAASGPVTQAMQPNPSHVANTLSANSTVPVTGDSQGYYTHPGFPMHGFPSFPAPQAAFPMQTYPMPNYPMPAPMYAPPYGYPFAPQGTTHAMQPNGYPAPNFLMQNYPMPNYPMPAPMYVPPSSYPSSYPFATPAPQGANLDYGRKYQSNPQASSSDPVDEAGPAIFDTSLTVNDWLNTDRSDPDTPEP